MKTAATPQLTGLQSLRGLAAVVVLFHHTLFYFETTPMFRFWSEALFNAHAAVMLFFVLSGFVLVRSLVRHEITVATTASFYTKRAFRIVPAMWVAIAVAALYFVSLSYLPAGPLTSAWYTTVKTPDTALQDYVKAIFALPSKGVLPPLWSIRVEIAACVVMPLFAMLAARGRATVGLFALVLCLGTLLASLWYVGAASYIALFAIGAALVPWFDNFRRNENLGLTVALAATIVLSFFRLLSADWRFEADFSAVFPGLIEGLAAAVLIGIVGARPQSVSLLTRPSLVYLGDISYSVYLLHFVVMEAVAKVMGMTLPGVTSAQPNLAALILTLSTLLVTVLASMVTYRYVERPGIELGSAFLRLRRDTHRVSA